MGSEVSACGGSFAPQRSWLPCVTASPAREGGVASPLSPPRFAAPHPLPNTCPLLRSYLPADRTQDCVSRTSCYRAGNPCRQVAAKQRALSPKGRGFAPHWRGSPHQSYGRASPPARRVPPIRIRVRVQKSEVTLCPLFAS